MQPLSMSVVSKLVNDLVAEGYTDVTVFDLSSTRQSLDGNERCPSNWSA
jgi:hypothetical protein